MSAAPWKNYNRLQEIAERYDMSTDELLHLASQGRLTLYGCLPPGVYLQKGPGGEPISAQFVRLNQGEVQKLELHGKVTLNQFDTAISVIDGVCIEHDSVGRHLDGLVSRALNRFGTKDCEAVTFERNDIFLIHERNLKAILRDDLWRSSVFDIDSQPECVKEEPDGEHPDFFVSDEDTGKETKDTHGSEGVSKRAILCVDWPLASSRSKKSLEAALGDVKRREWLKHACVGRPGAAGKESHQWNPALLAICLIGQGWITNRALVQKMMEKEYPEYLSQWEDIKERIG